MSKQTTTDFDKKIDYIISPENRGVIATRDTMIAQIKSAVSELVEECKPKELKVQGSKSQQDQIWGINYGVKKYERNLKEVLK